MGTDRKIVESGKDGSWKEEPHIEVARIEDVDALLDLQRAAFLPRARELDWMDAFPLVESRESAVEEFLRNTTLKLVLPDGRIIGSIRGCMEDEETLYVSRLMVHPLYWRRGYGRLLMEQIMERMPHERAWLYASELEPMVVRMYERMGFVEFGLEPGERNTQWIMMERILREGNSGKQ